MRASGAASRRQNSAISPCIWWSWPARANACCDSKGAIHSSLAAVVKRQTLVQHGVPIRIIPGISAGIGGLAYAGIPVTHRDVNQSVTFVTGHDQTGDAPGSLDWSAIAQGSQVIVIYMGMKHIAQIVQRLIAAGRSPSEPLAFVTSATLEHQNVVESTLGTAVDDAKAAGVEPPAIICIGRSVLMRQVLDWRSLEAGAAPRNLDPLDRGRPAESA